VLCAAVVTEDAGLHVGRLSGRQPDAMLCTRDAMLPHFTRLVTCHLELPTGGRASTHRQDISGSRDIEKYFIALNHAVEYGAGSDAVAP
jgi:hypothetical protein